MSTSRLARARLPRILTTSASRHYRGPVPQILKTSIVGRLVLVVLTFFLNFSGLGVFGHIYANFRHWWRISRFFRGTDQV